MLMAAERPIHQTMGDNRRSSLRRHDTHRHTWINTAYTCRTTNKGISRGTKNNHRHKQRPSTGAAMGADGWGVFQLWMIFHVFPWRKNSFRLD